MHTPGRGRIIAAGLVCLLVFAGVVLLRQGRELRRSRAEIVALQSELDDERVGNLEVQNRLKSLEKQGADLRENAIALRGALNEVGRSNRPSATSESPQVIESNPESPAQEALRIRRMEGAIELKQLYAPLLKDLGLDGVD